MEITKQGFPFKKKKCWRKEIVSSSADLCGITPKMVPHLEKAENNKKKYYTTIIILNQEINPSLPLTFHLWSKNTLTPNMVDNHTVTAPRMEECSSSILWAPWFQNMLKSATFPPHNYRLAFTPRYPFFHLPLKFWSCGWNEKLRKSRNPTGKCLHMQL